MGRGDVRFALFDQVEIPDERPLGAVYTDHFALAATAEAAGFDGIFKSEHHHVPLDAAPSINVYLGALTQRTERLRIGSLVHLLPFHEPMRLYEELSILDHLSGGRIDFGFGKGVSPPEHMLWRIDRAEIEARTTESLEIILGAMRAYHDHGPGHRFSHAGEFWTYDEAPLEVGPLQRPFPPLWRPGTLDTAAELGVSTIVAGPISHAADQMQRYRELQQPGLAPELEPTVSVLRRIHVAATDAEADARARAAWTRFDANLTKLFRRYGVWPPHVPSFKGDYDKAIETESLIAGGPATVRAHFDELLETTGAHHVMVCATWGDLAGDDARRSIELFAEHVMAA